MGIYIQNLKKYCNMSQKGTSLIVLDNFYTCFGSMLGFMIIFEIARRIPFLTLVYDRKRSVRPRYTPPPLMTTRHTHPYRLGSLNFRPPALFEFLFLNLGQDYVNYSAAILNIRKQEMHTTDDREELKETIVNDKLNISIGKGKVCEDGSLFLNDDLEEENNSTNSADGVSVSSSMPPCPSRFRHMIKDIFIYYALYSTAMKKIIDSIRKSSCCCRNSDNDQTIGRAKMRKAIKLKEQPSPLNEEDQKLLSSVGLDTYIMIRFLRFGYFATAPFAVLSCAVLMPIFYNAPDDTSLFDTYNNTCYGNNNNVTLNTNDIYYKLSASAVSSNMSSLSIPVVIEILFITHILWRWWNEWKIVTHLKHDYLANGSVDSLYDNSSFDSLIQYQNSIHVSYIPEIHRTDKGLYNFFDNLFPGEIKHAAMILNTDELCSINYLRMRNIEKHENISAKYSKKASGNSSKIRVNKTLGCGGEKVAALSYYEVEIKRYNKLADEEFKKIITARNKVELDEASLRNEGMLGFDLTQLLEVYKSFIPRNLLFGLGISDNTVVMEDGFVQFKSASTKQSAVQCNLTGKADWMVTENAPDPRDVIWKNMTCSTEFILKRRFIVRLLLIFSLVIWSIVTNFIINIMDPFSFQSSKKEELIETLLPLFLTIMLAVIPFILKIIGDKYICLKSSSEVDTFVLNWSTAYHFVQIVTIAIAGSLIRQISCFISKPALILEYTSISFNMESYMLLNFVVTQICVSSFNQLSQPFIVIYRIFGIKISAMSESKLNQMDEPKVILYGRYCPQFIYCFGIAALYCATVPLVVAVCAAYFFVAEKVYSHRCMFVFCQTHDGGGKLMEFFNRFLFLILYFSTTIVFTYLTLIAGEKDVTFLITKGVIYIILLFLIRRIQTRIHHYFIEPSSSLPMAR